MTRVTQYVDKIRIMKRRLNIAFIIFHLISSSVLAGNLTDGLYLEDTNSSSHVKLTCQDSLGKEHHFSVTPYTNLNVKSIRVYSLKPAEAGWHIQMNVESLNKEWTKMPLFLVVNNKPYFELVKVGESQTGTGKALLGSISVKFSDETDADNISEILGKRFNCEVGKVNPKTNVLVVKPPSPSKKSRKRVGNGSYE